ncbi:hypothetical protein MAFF211271_45930 (plasmid) [Ralstonia syzygii subsp. indonesiensis]|nr:hypothetical protein MAFF211271_45930 [Ralstonia pseudosolanacearum]
MNALWRREAKVFLALSDCVGIGQRSQSAKRPRERGRDFGDPRLGAHAAWIKGVMGLMDSSPSSQNHLMKVC